MPILTASELTKTFGGELLLEGVTFSIEPKEQVGLIGPNGAGKTTLLRLIAGLDGLDRGAVARAPWARVAFLPQLPQGDEADTVWDHVLMGAADVRALETRLRELEAQMSSPAVHDDPAHLAAVMQEYGTVQAHFEHAGGFTLEARAGIVLAGLGFIEGDRPRRLGTLSGGWRVRAELARVLLAEPDLLLLDEPTNHLDLDALEWLETYLHGFPGAAIVVSHDRHLLDAVTARTLELEDRRVTVYPGAYSVYVRLKAEQQARQRELSERQQEEIAKLEDYIRRYHAGNRATMAKSREKRLSRVRDRSLATAREARTLRVQATAGGASGKTVATLRGVRKRYGEREILGAVDLLLFRGERIGLLGPNGSGKSTLLKLIAGLEPPTDGRVQLGTDVRVAYFAQEPSLDLDPAHTVLDEVLGDRPMSPEAVRTYLGQFLFSGEDVYKRASMLSGGERQRLGLATLLLDQPNVLLLDEPTNHLDIPSREALEAALQDFSGTIIVATHDRYLLERLATRILVLHDGRVSDFDGTYQELRARRARQQTGPLGQQAGPPRRERRIGRPAPQRPGATPAPSIDDLAIQIAAVERDLDEAGRRLGDPELYRDPDRVREVRRQYAGAEQRLAELYALLERLDAPTEPPAG